MLEIDITFASLNQRAWEIVSVPTSGLVQNAWLRKWYYEAKVQNYDFIQQLPVWQGLYLIIY